MAHTGSKPILYSYFRSTPSWRVRIALAYKGIDYEYKAVDITKNDGWQTSDEYKKLNPSKQVPALVIDGLSLAQSLPIIEYLEETRPEKSLLPRDPGKRCKARQIAEIVNSGIQPLQNLSVLLRVSALAGEEKKTEWALFYIKRGLEAIEAILKETAGKYSVGDEVTIADVYLVPQVDIAGKFNVDMSDFPTIHRVNEECIKLDSFKAAVPTAQPDCPADLKG